MDCLEPFDLKTNIKSLIKSDKKLIPETIADLIINISKESYKEKYETLGKNRLLLEKQIMLQVLDVHWKEHLAEIDHLRGSVGLRAYAQKNPKNEFKQEAYSMFEFMLNEIDSETIRILFSIQFNTEEVLNDLKKKEKDEVTLEKPDALSPIDDSEANTKIEELPTNTKTVIRDEPKHGRNEIIKITNGHETKEMKYKKAKDLIESGDWRIL